MEAKTYRVKSISEAIEKIRDELGPDASVLHTRRLKNSLWSWLNGNRYEVVASNEVAVPDRFQQWLHESITETEDLVQEGLTQEAFTSVDRPSNPERNTTGELIDDQQTAQPYLDEAGNSRFSATDFTDQYQDEFRRDHLSHNQNDGPHWSEPGNLGASFVSRGDESFDEFLGLNRTMDQTNEGSEGWNQSTSAFEASLLDRSGSDQISTENHSRPRNRHSAGHNNPGSIANQHQHGWEQLYAWLRSCGADSEAADLLCTDLKKLYAMTKQESSSLVECPAWDELVSLLGSQLKRGGTIQNRVGRCQRVAFVGPTGVGKTTTLAKLAGEYKLRRGLDVGLITVDTYRVAAVDQLKAYAGIMKTPLEVVGSEAEMQAAVESMDKMDLVLIDTIGRSPSDAHRIRQLQDILRIADLDQLYLTLSAGSSLASLQRSYEGYQSLTATSQSSLILTKVDECSSLGGVYPFLKDCPLTWSYWTNGQDVPDDLGVAKDNVALWFLDQISDTKKH